MAQLTEGGAAVHLTAAAPADEAGGVRMGPTGTQKDSVSNGGRSGAVRSAGTVRWPRAASARTAWHPAGNEICG